MFIDLKEFFYQERTGRKYNFYVLKKEKGISSKFLTYQKENAENKKKQNKINQWGGNITNDEAFQEVIRRKLTIARKVPSQSVESFTLKFKQEHINFI